MLPCVVYRFWRYSLQTSFSRPTRLLFPWSLVDSTGAFVLTYDLFNFRGAIHQKPFSHSALHAGNCPSDSVPFLHPLPSSFSNDVVASLVTHPNLVDPARLNIHSAARPKCRFSRPLVFREGNRKGTAADQMGREAVVGVGSVVHISAPVIVSFESREADIMINDERGE